MTGPFGGVTVIITGEAHGFSREGANDAIVRLGGQPVSSVSAKTGLVIMGNGAGVSKMHKARLHNRLVIDEGQFLDLVTAYDSGTWDGGTVLDGSVGVPVKEYDAAHPDPGAGDASTLDPSAHIPLSERHLVSLAVVFPSTTGRVGPGLTTRVERRYSCSCGHRWLGSVTSPLEECPVDADPTGATRPDSSSPWANSVFVSSRFSDPAWLAAHVAPRPASSRKPATKRRPVERAPKTPEPTSSIPLPAAGGATSENDCLGDEGWTEEDWSAAATAETFALDPLEARDASPGNAPPSAAPATDGAVEDASVEDVVDFDWDEVDAALIAAGLGEAAGVVASGDW